MKRSCFKSVKPPKPLRRTPLKRTTKPKPVMHREKRTTPVKSGPWASGAKLKALVKETVAVHGWFCHYCFCRLNADTITLDHRIARSQGGPDSIDNLLPCCARCNSVKGPRSYAWMIEQRPMLRRTAKITSFILGRS